MTITLLKNRYLMWTRLVAKQPIRGVGPFLKMGPLPKDSFRLQWKRNGIRSKTNASEMDGAEKMKYPDEILGQVMTAEANFVKVKVLTSDMQLKKIPINFQMSPSSKKLSRLECFKSLADAENGIYRNHLLCVVRSVLKKMHCPVLVGDFVKVVSIDWPDLRGMVSEVLPRESHLMDPPVANIDHILVLISICQPKFDALQATRFLLEAESTYVPVTLAINKIDLQTNEEVLALSNQVMEWGYHPTLLSCHTSEGINSLTKVLEDKISVVMGPSGVGKSSLINTLRRKSEFVSQAVNEVSSVGRGRHTTRTISLLPLPAGGFLADTPDLSSISSQEVSTLFPEAKQLIKSHGSCSFSNCRHVMEPGCIVREAMWERYPLYVKLLEEIEEREKYERRVLQLSKQRREGKVKRKIRKGGRYAEEVLLETKRYRRVSRTRQQKELRDIIDEDYEGEEL